jgi:hypothetical protein
MAKRDLKTWSRVYARVARAFPHNFRVICGDGLERLGMDLVPIIYREQGVTAVMRCFADLIMRLPVEYASGITQKLKEITMADDPFEGTWRSNNDKSQFDSKYSPEQACIRFEATDAGYLMVAYGIMDGQAVAERLTSIIPDGRRRPIVDLNGRPVPGVPA